MRDIKATYHNGRWGSARHNDRDFNKSPDDGHIDWTRTEKNTNTCVYPGMAFKAAEQKYYEEHFREWVEKRNEASHKARHYDRDITVEDLLKSKRT